MAITGAVAYIKIDKSLRLYEVCLKIRKVPPKKSRHLNPVHERWEYQIRAFSSPESRTLKNIDISAKGPLAPL